MARGGLTLRWLGTAGHVISTGSTTVVVDPFVTRPGLRALLSPLRPDLGAIDRWLPARVDAVLLGHSHYDHLLDAPSLARARGALVVGTPTTAAFARAAGVDADRIVVVPPEGRTLTVGDITVRFVPSLHNRLVAGRVPLSGEVREPPSLPVRALRYRMGGAFGIQLEAGGLTLYHNGSADLVDAELAGHRADVLLVGLAGRGATRDYLARLIGLLAPTVVVPTHHDAFFAPLEEGERLLPGIDFEGFLSEAAVLAPRARVVTPLYHDAIALPLEGDARELVVEDW